MANGQSNPNLKIRYQSGLAALDLLNAEYRQLTGKEFIDQNWTTEHYAYRGRMIIAKHLAEALRKQFPAQYMQAY